MTNNIPIREQGSSFRVNIIIIIIIISTFEFKIWTKDQNWKLRKRNAKIHY